MQKSHSLNQYLFAFMVGALLALFWFSTFGPEHRQADAATYDPMVPVVVPVVHLLN